jgi:hypothetical protein
VHSASTSSIYPNSRRSLLIRTAALCVARRCARGTSIGHESFLNRTREDGIYSINATSSSSDQCSGTLTYLNCFNIENLIATEADTAASQSIKRVFTD